MKLLVSAIDCGEARACIAGGADIVDVKNPKEGSLGGHSPEVIKKIRKIVPKSLILSATVGDVPNKPGLVAQAALGLAVSGVDYVKIGLCDHFTVQEAIYLVRLLVQAIKPVNKNIKVAVCGYADAALKSYILPKHIPRIVKEAGAQVAMIDTLSKGDGKGLFSFLSEGELLSFSRQSRHFGLQVALAGSLNEEDVIRIRDKKLCDLIGVRTLACRGGKRSSTILAPRVKEIKKLLSQ
jgi:uncharacterized protein (UPF0264 family)